MNTVFKFELTADEANLILAGLSELPAKVSLALINKIQQQGQAQIQPAPATVPATEAANG